MEQLLSEFAARFGLSPREREIYGLLAGRVTTFKEISKKLKVSPNTVNNHFKSIFLKTGTRGKTELLAIFVRHLADKYFESQARAKRPRVLLISEDGSALEDGLSQRGCRVDSLRDVELVPQSLRQFCYDALIYDHGGAPREALDLLARVRRDFPMRPSVFLTYNQSPDPQWIIDIMDRGAAGAFGRPCDLNQVAAEILEDFTEEPDYFRYWEKSQNVPVVSLPIELSSRDYFMGFRGIFIPLGDGLARGPLNPEIAVGTLLRFSFQIEGIQGNIPAIGRVVWKRALKDGEKPAGLGVKFLCIEKAPLQQLVERHLRRLQPESYIPAGPHVSIQA